MKITLLIFIIIESLNVLTLYFNPSSKYGNGIGVFNAFEKSKSDEEVHGFVKYLINWVAGTKLIFILLILTIVFTGDELTQKVALIAMILSIMSFFWRLYPSIKEMDLKGWITPKGYSKGLFWMIAGFIMVFTMVLLINL